MVDGLRAVSHLRHLLQHHGVMHRVLRILSPGEGSVILAQYRGNGYRVLAHSQKFADDQFSCILLVGIGNFFRSETSEAGNLSIDIIRMCGAVAGNASDRKSVV